MLVEKTQLYSGISIVQGIVQPPNLPVITTTSPLPSATKSVAYSTTISATSGITPYTWSITSDTPDTGSWLSINSSSGVLSGTPGTAETETVVIKVTDNVNNTASTTFSLTVNATTLSITTSSPLTSATVGTSYSDTIAATGGVTPYTWSITSDSPDTGSWLSINSSTGVLSGTPGTAETETVVIKVTDSDSNTASKSFSLVVNPAALSITTSSPLSSATTGTAYSTTIAATGGVTPYTWSITSDSPDTGSWLSINSSSGVLSGTPGTAETETVVIKVTDSASNTASKSFTLVVNASGTFKPAYPRIGSYYIGGGTYNQEWANYLANFPLNVISPYVGTGTSMYGGTKQAWLTYARSLSTVNAKFLQYYDTGGGDNNGTTWNNGLPQPNTELNNFPNWWAWTNSQNHTGVVDAPESSDQLTNQCSGPSGLVNNGQVLEQWFADYVYDAYVTGTGGLASSDVSNLDGFFHDNWYFTPAENYDYNQTGSATSNTNSAFISALQAGMTSGATVHKNNGMMIMVNFGSASINTDYNGVPDAVLYEGSIGFTYSPMYGSGFGYWFGLYQDYQTASIDGFVMVGHTNVTTSGADPYQGDWAAARYGLTATLMENGFYFAAVNNGYGVNGTYLWFDEWSVNPTTGVANQWNGSASSVSSGMGYMGLPTSTWGTVQGNGNYQIIDSAYVRMFYNASTGKTWVAICGPNGAGTPGSASFTVSATTLHSGSAGFKMISGTQDSSVNTGDTVSSITLSNYDGRIAELL